MLSETPRQRLRMSELAAIVVQSRSRLTHTATRLEKRGWVTREPCEFDRRGVELVLTKEGAKRVLKASIAHVDSVQRHLLDVMTPKQLTALGEAMALVRDALSEPRDAALGADCDEVRSA